MTDTADGQCRKCGATKTIELLPDEQLEQQVKCHCGGLIYPLNAELESMTSQLDGCMMAMASAVLPMIDVQEMIESFPEQYGNLPDDAGEDDHFRLIGKAYVLAKLSEQGQVQIDRN